MKVLILGITLLVSINSHSWVETRTELVKCNKVNSTAEISFNLIEDYDNVDDVTSMGFEITSVDKRFSDAIYRQMYVLDNESPVSYYGITSESNSSDKLHFRTVSFNEIDLTDEDLISSIDPQISNLSNLKKFGRTLVTEFIIDKASGKGKVRSLQAIGHSATLYDELHDYEVENCVIKEEIPTKYLSIHSSFDEL